MRTGSRAAAIAVFISTPAQPSSIAIAASEAVPTPGIDQHRHLRRLDDELEIPGVEDAHPRSDQRGEGHDRDAADRLELARDDGVVGRVDQHLEAVADERLRGLDRRAHVREQGLRVAQHLELDQRVAVEQLARELQRAHGVVGRIAAGGVGQIGELGRRQRVQQRRRIRILADVRPADRHGDDLRTGRDDRRAGLGEIPVLAGADEKARTVCAAGDDQRVDDGATAACAERSWPRFYSGPGQTPSASGRQPPPTAPTISSLSPSATEVSA